MGLTSSSGITRAQADGNQSHGDSHASCGASPDPRGSRKTGGLAGGSFRLRFDFTFPRPLTDEELEKIEQIINQEIKRGSRVSVKEMAFDEAMKSGALAFFDEKYGDHVRVVRVGGPGDQSSQGNTDTPFSVELCGGTHLDTISDIGFFKILSESSVASGVRRIEAITSESALGFLTERNRLLESLEEKLGTKGDGLIKKIDQLMTDIKVLQREKEKLQMSLAQGGAKGGGGQALWEKKTQVKDIQIVREKLPAIDPKILRTLVDQVRDKLKDRTIAFSPANQMEKRSCVWGFRKIWRPLGCGQIIQPLAEEVGGKGGGRGDFAQAGGTNPAGLSKAFEKFDAWIQANV